MEFSIDIGNLVGLISAALIIRDGMCRFGRDEPKSEHCDDTGRHGLYRWCIRKVVPLPSRWLPAEAASIEDNLVRLPDRRPDPGRSFAVCYNTAMHDPWTPDLVRDRLREAMRSLRALRDPRMRPAGYRSAWPDVVHQAAEAYGYNQARTSLPAPAPAEIDRMDEALPWLAWIEDRRQRVALTGVAMGFSLRAVGRALGVSHECAQAWQREALQAICRRLNERRDRAA